MTEHSFERNNMTLAMAYDFLIYSKEQATSWLLPEFLVCGILFDEDMYAKQGAAGSNLFHVDKLTYLSHLLESEFSSFARLT